jgi:xylulose-5-phosphate/fructose-6-phosphate phosphoketolase
MSSPTAPLSNEEVKRIDAYWRACNYLAAGMIYLRDNPLLKEPLKLEHIKKPLAGSLGLQSGLGVWLYPHESPDQQI